MQVKVFRIIKIDFNSCMEQITKLKRAFKSVKHFVVDSNYAKGEGVCRYGIDGQPPDHQMTATVNTVTEAEWLSVVGPRVPAAGPEKYKLVQVVFSDELLTPGQMSFFDEGMRRAIQKNSAADFTLYEATQGLLEIEPYLIPGHRLASDLVIIQDTTFLAKSSVELDSVVIQAPYSVVIQAPETQMEHFECQLGAVFETILQSGCDQN